ncbi:hypothetical protein ACI0FM_07865 [Paenochrobactrum sp. BZR 588]|uniref:hypothetical protein n=1 Tax=unclassified Paenochrobactrum TaxID=2639760 RepID=UPI0038552DE4
MDVNISSVEVFTHVRVIMGIVLGLSISRLLMGVARIIQHPQRKNIYPIHLGWVVFTFLTVVHFWWYELYLNQTLVWRFEAYLFLIFFASLHFLACSLLFPDSMEGYSGFEHYFMSRRSWFFGILIAIFLVDFADTALKGMDHFHKLGMGYLLRNGFFVVVFGAAIYARQQRMQWLLLITAIVCQISFIWLLYDII